MAAQRAAGKGKRGLLAARSGGVAAVNGGYFSTAAPICRWKSIIDGEILAASTFSGLHCLENRSASSVISPEICVARGSRIPVES